MCRYTDIWQEVEKTETVKEIQEKKIRLKPEFIFNDFVKNIQGRINLERRV